MTAASTSPNSESPGSEPGRRKRFERAAAEAGAPTAAQLDVLYLLAENRFLSTAQVEIALGRSDKTAREHLRRLFDLKLADRMAVAGALVGSGALLAHNVHFPTVAGLRALERVGREVPGEKRRSGGLSPTGYLGHELAVRDVWAFLSASAARNPGHLLETWDCSSRLDVGGVYADAVFAYRAAESGPGSVLAGFVEADMGTQRATSGRGDRWGAKAEAYAKLFSPESVPLRKALTGYLNGVLLVTVPDAERAQWVRRRLAGTPAAPYALVAVRSELIPPPPKREPGKPQGKRPPLPDVHAAVWGTHDGRTVPLLRRR